MWKLFVIIVPNTVSFLVKITIYNCSICENIEEYRQFTGNESFQE